MIDSSESNIYLSVKVSFLGTPFGFIYTANTNKLPSKRLFDITKNPSAEKIVFDPFVTERRYNKIKFLFIYLFLNNSI